MGANQQLGTMRDCLRAPHVRTFVEAVAADHPHHFSRTLRAAYAGGAEREDVPAAADINRQVAELPAPVRAKG
ncbi:MAG TPA: hypothetical protein VIG69_06945 [Candidatus Methylomirabilis sp.]|jgi:hypothetical protein